jgi:YVTN family beta-propeller protein
MLRFNTQNRRRFVTVLTLLFALCAAGIVPAAATTQTNPVQPVITSAQLNLPSAGQITIDGTGFGSDRPTVTMGDTPLAVNDGFSNTKIVANLPAPLPAAGNHLLAVTNAQSRLSGVLTVNIGGAGTQGPKGDKGDPGTQGPQGDQGPAGANGVSPVGVPEPAGSNCQYGGLKYTDAQGVHYVCNGAPGSGNTMALEARLLALERRTFPIAYVTNTLSNTVSAVNVEHNTVSTIATVSVGTAPLGVAVNPTGTHAYVANGGNNNVSVIDTATNTVVATIAVGSGPVGVTFNPAGTLAYVANEGTNNVSVIDTMSNTVVATIQVGTSPWGVAVR